MVIPPKSRRQNCGQSPFATRAIAALPCCTEVRRARGFDGARDRIFADIEPGDLTRSDGAVRMNQLIISVSQIGALERETDRLRV
jgi:hypothetical protein